MTNKMSDKLDEDLRKAVLGLKERSIFFREKIAEKKFKETDTPMLSITNFINSECAAATGTIEFLLCKSRFPGVDVNIIKQRMITAGLQESSSTAEPDRYHVVCDVSNCSLHGRNHGILCHIVTVCDTWSA